ncbi:MAG: hypothetical protein GC162_13940 [Planctomycetes bacterium]|nr:hypothetical protein [Planctomycetota bacterium]
MAKAYRAQQREGAVLFEREHQLLIVRIARGADAFIDAIVHAVATEPTHAHVLISWKHDRDWKSMRTSVRSAITRALNEQFGKRSWFSDSPSRKRVHDIEHFDYLMLEYLPKHSGVQWFREADVKAARRRAAK